MIANAFFAFLGYLPWVSLLIVILLVLRRSKLRLCARFYRGAWLLLALRCGVPVAISLPRLTPLVRVAVPEYLLETAASGQVFPLVPQVASPMAPPAGLAAVPQPQGVQEISWLALGALLWAVGVAVVLLWRFTSYGLFLWHLRKTRSKAKAEICAQGRQIWGRKLRVYETDLLHSPSLVGFLRPVVYLSRAAELSGSALTLVLRHEHCHAQQGDLLGKLLLTVAQAVCWPNPLVWVMCRVAQNDMECACDERLLGSKTTQERKAYGAVILQTLTGGRKGNVLCTHFSGSPKALKERFHAMFEMKEKKQAKGLLVVLAGAVALASALVACAPTPTGEAISVGGAAVEANAASTGAQASEQETVEEKLAELQMELKGESSSAPADSKKAGAAGGATMSPQIPYLFLAQATPITLEKVDANITRITAPPNEVKTVCAPLAGVVEEVRGDNTMRIAHEGGLFSEIIGMESTAQMVGAAVSQAQTVGTLATNTPLTIQFFHEGFGEEALQAFYEGLEILVANQAQTAYKQAYVTPISAKSLEGVSAFFANGHRGIDIKAQEGEPVLAVQSGTVIEAALHQSWGNYIKIAHADGLATLYAHLDSMAVKVGDTVAQGQKIGEVGSTGTTTGYNLHFETYASGGQLVDPVTIITLP